MRRVGADATAAGVGAVKLWDVKAGSRVIVPPRAWSGLAFGNDGPTLKALD